jgi:hypothetical protein
MRLLRFRDLAPASGETASPPIKAGRDDIVFSLLGSRYADTPAGTREETRILPDIFAFSHLDFAAI